jgi:hypothetical protein
MVAEYNYRALDLVRKEIRLLVFENAGCPPNELLKFSMKYVSLDTRAAQDYYAISYVWGNATKQKAMIIDNQTVGVPENAEIALRNLNPKASPAPRFFSCLRHRQGRHYLPVWIDAICINQSDYNERGHQVGMMDRVYSQAAAVFIWLGEDHTSVMKRATKSIRQIVKQCRRETNGLKDIDAHVWTMTSRGPSARYSSSPLPRKIDWHAIASFYSAAWFERLWVVQETLLAKSAICYHGSLIIPWPDVALAAKWMFHRRYFHAQYIGREIRGILNASRMFDRNRSQNTIYDWLQMSFNFRTTVDLDKVFAILGLIGSPQIQPTASYLVPNYEKSVAEVFSGITMAAIEQSKHISILMFANRMLPYADENPHITQSPSWVPRYDWRYDEERGSTSLVVALHEHGADDGIDANFERHSSSSQILRLQGLLVTDVLHTSPSLDLQVLRDRYLLANKIVPMLSVAQSLGGNGNDCEVRLEKDFGLTLTAGATKDLHEADSDPVFASDFEAFINDCRRISIDSEENFPPMMYEKSLSDHTSDSSTEGSYHEALLVNSPNRSFFVTTDGRMGMGPPDLQPHDQICVLFGHHSPFALRQEGKCFKLVGDLYVHGIQKVSFTVSLLECIGI